MLLLSLLVSVASLASARPSSPKAQVLDCLQAAGIPDNPPGSLQFAALETPFNLRLNYTPSVIVTPRTEQELAVAVKCACGTGVKVQARSGGHSYASFSMGGQDGSMIIDLENFINVVPNFDKQHPTLAYFGGGVRLGNLDTALYNARRALSHGTCSGIGVGGHFPHGGYGHTSRNWGLAMDAIVALDVVTADGKIIHTSPDPKEEPDLFWAMRGAADSFGIITNFYVETQPAPETIINFGYSISGMYEDKARFVKFFQHLQDYVLHSEHIDRKISIGMYMDGQIFNFIGQYFGDQLFFNNTIVPELFSTLGNGTWKGNPGSQKVDWLKSIELLNGAPIQYSLERTDYTHHDNFFAKSLTIPEPLGFNEQALQSYHDYIVAKGVEPTNPWFSIVNLYGGRDSMINTKDTDFAAYKDRHALWVMQHYGFNDPGKKVDLDFVHGLNDAITRAMPKDAGIGAYLNYIDPSLSRQEAIDVYYGKDVYGKLQILKKKYDPEGVFWNPFAVEV
ncbi:carbohydrate-binding module family 18 [Venturia nashicola]|uniref:Carbohydrate-binding module family 18 n=1 Tax=Venturia nashicola TaxID=86259 RepID=A0A4Z1P2S5_9PEZI|nr:carbohydrate-binding module family 18 [Venturia nashicola]TLD23437.1 carbohydrate-binding module family 18 [Venturia nashicola]